MPAPFLPTNPSFPDAPAAGDRHDFVVRVSPWTRAWISSIATSFHVNTNQVVLWLLEGQVLSSAERASLVALSQREPRLKLVVEMGGSRALRWQPLAELV